MVLRNDFEYNIDQVSIIDSQVIFYMMEPRTLSGALKYYCDKTLKDAHSALADTRATLNVFKGQVTYKAVADVFGHEYINPNKII